MSVSQSQTVTMHAYRSL